ncbi:response regulator transcription factor [Paraburkholderia sp. LEh10]|uniref:response regulator transcription factor n=1 Tax=Paraburkholderia sp. LEh10 TaxID=2821353 RepID=UPI001AE5FA91|nr:response regulator transcription factor [Paraburkholderia sp. LEh10]MBP0595866.1 response regulator transcription factor [Paraburkholderia sp. LEh10]
MKILLVEDNRQVAGFLKKGLMETGHVVDSAYDGRDGMFLAMGASYDAIILDRMLPGGIDGLSIVSALRATGNKIPILILSALDEVDERIRGLKAGGDDYVVKPFAFGEVLARLEVLTRRSQDSMLETTLQVGDLCLDLLSRKASRAGKPIVLKSREFKLLEYMMRHAEQVLTRTMLLENIWEYNFDPQTNVIDVHVSKLRQKIDAGFDRSLLRTVRNAGYMLTADI